MNTEGTKNFVNALKATNQPMKRFVYLSSLSVFGAIREKMPHTGSKSGMRHFVDLIIIYLDSSTIRSVRRSMVPSNAFRHRSSV